jgi:hypothetical protein
LKRSFIAAHYTVKPPKTEPTYGRERRYPGVVRASDASDLTD